jgi:hypothetical protein
MAQVSLQSIIENWNNYSASQQADIIASLNPKQTAWLKNALAAQGDKDQAEANEPTPIGEQLAITGGAAAATGLGYSLGGDAISSLGSLGSSSAPAATATSAGAGTSGAYTLPTTLTYGAEGTSAAGAGAAGAEGAGAAGAEGAGAGAGWGSTVSAVAPYLAGAAALYLAGNTAYDDMEADKEEGHQGNAWSGASAGADRWWDDTGGALADGDWKTALSNWWQWNPNVAMGRTIGGAVNAQFGSGKDRDQMDRDRVRDYWKDQGLIEVGEDGNWYLTLADGTKFDIGKDGGAMLQNQSTNIDGQPDRHYYDVDWSNASSPEMAGYLKPLALAMSGISDEKLNSDFTGYLTNAVQSSGDQIGNIKSLYEQFGGEKDPRVMVYGNVWQQWANSQGSDNAMTSDERDAQLAAIDKLYGVANPNDTRPDEMAMLNQLRPKDEDEEEEAPAQAATTEDKSRGWRPVNNKGRGLLALGNRQ